MNSPNIFARKHRYSASDIRKAFGDALLKIKTEDNLSCKDIGRVLGKSADAVEKYINCRIEPSATTLCFAWEAWGSRAVGTLRQMFEDADAETTDAHHAQGCILKVALSLNEALTDGNVTPAEIFAIKTELENARDAIDAQLARLKPRSVTA